jgi:hypothetical protein
MFRPFGERREHKGLVTRAVLDHFLGMTLVMALDHHSLAAVGSDHLDIRKSS